MSQPNNQEKTTPEAAKILTISQQSLKPDENSASNPNNMQPQTMETPAKQPSTADRRRLEVFLESERKPASYMKTYIEISPRKLENIKHRTLAEFEGIDLESLKRRYPEPLLNGETSKELPRTLTKVKPATEGSQRKEGPGGFMADAIKGKSRIEKEQEELLRLKSSRKMDEEKASTSSARETFNQLRGGQRNTSLNMTVDSELGGSSMMKSIEKPPFNAASLHKEHFSNLTPHTWDAVNDIVARYSNRAISAKSSNCKAERPVNNSLSGKIKILEDQGDLCDCCSHPRRSLRDCKERVSKRASLKNEVRNSFMEEVEENEEEAEPAERSASKQSGQNPISQFDIETTSTNWKKESGSKIGKIEEEGSHQSP